MISDSLHTNEELWNVAFQCMDLAPYRKETIIANEIRYFWKVISQKKYEERKEAVYKETWTPDYDNEQTQYRMA